MEPARRDQEANEAGEHHEHDDPRLQQHEPVLNASVLRLGQACNGSPGCGNGGLLDEVRHQRTRGSSSKVWKGGGDVTVHSSVVAPSPQ